MNKQLTAGNGKKILFASVPADGHFNPLTGLAKHLQSLGYEVRWYTSSYYAPKLKRLDIPHYPFVKAKDVSGDEIDNIFPERTKIKSKIKKLNYDLKNYFILRAPEYYNDIKDIYRDYKFDLFVADVLFTAIPFVAELMEIPVFSMGIVPLMQTSKDLPPAGLGLTPGTTWLSKVRDSILRFMAENVLFSKADKLMKKIMEGYYIEHDNKFLFDLGISKATYYLQSGTPGFEYKRSDMMENVRFIGSLLPHSNNQNSEQWFDERLNQYKRVVLVTQGTVEKNINKLLVPTIEAFKHTDTLVVVTTGGSQTNELRASYPQNNIIIEDFIAFDDIMPYADVYVTNGGYGGVMLAIENRVPMVTAGVHEGKNEICARVGYFKLGVDLKTELPKAEQIRKAVDEVTGTDQYRINIQNLANEFQQYDANRLFANLVAEVLQPVNDLAFSNKYSEKIF
ncbi:nucleotide disphospho-sugar-binding domain-containing protein [Lacibacter sp.]|uniref:glycosyltransferase n=1 Tax=Lacibacter sp. TaxID=1915409 RepID=UPI002B4AB425|nr:nucleotide disphospho-sugar-binding domain-containing protein [Lacibacter sp.]HLP38680.1 nucleotide disphospho-sugar-binding domain-containing protein [Lacibacter sp.]